MRKKHKEIIGQIYYIASDGRGRLLSEDQIEWLERKLAEVKRLAELLPKIKCEKSNVRH